MWTVNSTTTYLVNPEHGAGWGGSELDPPVLGNIQIKDLSFCCVQHCRRVTLECGQRTSICKSVCVCKPTCACKSKCEQIPLSDHIQTTVSLNSNPHRQMWLCHVAKPNHPGRHIWMPNFVKFVCCAKRLLVCSMEADWSTYWITRVQWKQPSTQRILAGPAEFRDCCDISQGRRQGHLWSYSCATRVILWLETLSRWQFQPLSCSICPYHQKKRCTESLAL